jgi:hypothetical protein
MVRFVVLNWGPLIHVKDVSVLLDKNNDNYPHKEKIKLIFLNSLDISNISLTDRILEEFGLLSIAERELKNTIVRRKGRIG